MRRCSRCNEPMPLLSKVCPVCGNVEVDEDSVSAEEMANELELILSDLKDIPVPGFVSTMSRFSVFVLPILAVFLFIMAWISSAGLFWILFGIMFVWALVQIVRKIKGSFKADIAEKEFRELKSRYELTYRIANRDYGQNPEVKKLLKNISSEMSEVEGRFNSAKRSSLMVWVGLIILIVILMSTGTFSINSVVDNVEKTKSSIEYRIEQYKSATEDERNNPDLRYSLVRDIVKSGNMEFAESFFFEYILGNVGDFECAKEILKAYTGEGLNDKADAFVDKCSDGMRYPSDFKKLRNLNK